MKRNTYILLSLILTVTFCALMIWNFSANSVSAQKAETDENLGFVLGGSEYNARDEFALTQGGTSGVWRYGYTTSDASNAFVPYSLTAVNTCSGSPANGWIFSNSGDTTPVLYRFDSPSGCNGTLPDSLFVHPGAGGERVILRWVAPAAGTYQLNGALQRANPSATTDIRILKNETTSLFSGSVNSQFQQSFNFTVTVAANDTIDFSVGYGNGVFFSDGSSLNVVVSQPATVCLTAPANLQVNVPAENSPSDVQSVNTNASLVGDATYTNTGKVGRAFELDGNGDYVRVEDNAAQRPANAVTAEGWFKFDSTGGIVSLISKPVRGSALNSYTLYLEGGQLRGLIGNASQYTRALSSFTPQTGVWHHLAFTYDYTGGISTLHLYANGVEVTSGVDGTANLPLYYDANPFPLLIGGEYETNAQAFYLDGQADEVAVYGRALAQSEIFDIVQQGSFGKCSPVPCAQTPNNLISLFAGEQNALDSKSNNHGASQNGATFGAGKVGQAFIFDGVNDNVTVPNSPSLNITGNQLTIESWIYLDSTFSDNAQIVAMATGTNAPADRKYGLSVNTAGNLVFEVNTANGYIGNVPGAVVPTNTFVHVAGVYNGSTATLYINGAPAGTQSLTGNIVSSVGNLTIGQFAVGGFSTFKGLIDEVGIYNRALSQTEIQSIINAGSSGKCKPVATNPAANLVGFWTGDGDFRDFAGEDQNGTNSGVTFKVGKVGQSFNFTADPQNVSIPDSAAMRPANFTVEAWTKSTNNGGVRHIFAKTLGTGTSDSYVLWVENGNLNGSICSTPSSCLQIGTSAPNTGEWHHLALTFDDASDTLRIFIDGVQATSGTTAISIGYDTHPVLIGADYGNESIFDSWNGLIDEVSFYNRALTQPEIAAVYNAGTAGKLKSKTIGLPVIAPQQKSKTKIAASSLLASVSVQLSDATVSFANLTSSGTVSENVIDLANLPPMPASVTFTGLAYDISTTAGYQNGSADDVQVCFNLPSLASLNFANLRILHLESGVWQNRTMTGGSSPVICTDNLSSLSPFVIVQALVPTAANVSVSGKVADADGGGLSGVIVMLTDSQGRSVSTRTNNFGRYSFAGVGAGEVYTVSVASKRYSFNVSSQAINVTDAIENVDFIGSQTSLFNLGKPEMK